jgi:DNA modification methylase
MNNTSETVSIKKLTGWDKNPRGIKKDDYNRLKKQIQDLGVYKPLLVNEDYVVLGGNMRLKVLTDLGVENVWVSVVKASTPEMMTKYALSDNDEAGYYEEQQLAELLQPLEINLDDYRVNLGKPISITELLAKFGPDVVEDEPPAVEEEAISKRGEIYQLGRHRLMCGDAIDAGAVSILMNRKKANMTFTDPPYLMDFTGNVHADGSKSHNAKFGEILNDNLSEEDKDKFIVSFIDNIKQFTVGAYYICWYRLGLHYLFSGLKDNDLEYKALIIWDKGNHTLSNSDYQSRYEPIVYGWVDEHKFYGGRSCFDLWSIPRTQKNELHPTMKPVALCAKAITDSTEQNGIVLDLFGGSGSTLIACEQTNRICYMMELDPRYVDVIRKRYALFIGKGDEWEATTPIA